MTTYYNYLGQAMAVSADPHGNTVNATAEGQTITLPTGPASGAANDHNGAYNHVTLIGSDGDNIFYINNNSDLVQVADGLSGLKSIVVWSGGYTLPDNVKNLTFFGAGNWGAGNALDNLIIMGRNDKNTMDGGAGNDVLVGGYGENTFQFEAGGGHDVFYGFKADTDTLRIAGANFTSFAQIQSAMSQVGSDVVLTLNAHDSITFRGASVSSFQARDFLLPLDRSQLGSSTFSDDFTSLKLFNASTHQGNWQTNFGGDLTSVEAYSIKSSNDEKQLYTAPGFKGKDGYDLSAYNPFTIEGGGVLDITAGRFSYADSQHTWGQAYYSGMLNSRGVFMQKYGYFEMKAELPTGSGSWPAFWLSQDPYKPGVEADVLEHLGMYPDLALSRVNQQEMVDGKMTGVVTGHTTYMPSPGGFHTYGMMWGPSTTTFYVDDLAIMQVATPPSWDKPMYMLLDLALGGWGGPIDQSSLPSQMKVDYVHVYGLASSPVEISEGFASYTAPSGVNTVNLLGTGQTAAANNDGMTLVSNGGNHLIGGAGADTFVLGAAGGDVVSGSGGADTFVVSALTTHGQITDFSSADKIDLSGLFANLGYTGSDAVADGVLKFADDGHGGAQVWAQSGGTWVLTTSLGGVGSSDLHLTGAIVSEAAPPLAGGGGTPDPGTGGGTPDPGTGGGTPDPGTGGGTPAPGTGGGTPAPGPTGGTPDPGPSGGSSSNIDPVVRAMPDFNGDHYADILFREPGAGQVGYVAFGAGGASTWTPIGPSTVSYSVVGKGDFNADGHTDILFREASTGNWGYQAMATSGAGTWQNMGASTASYNEVQTGDFNGDGRSDIAFREASTGNWGVAQMTGAGSYAWLYQGGSTQSYAMVGAGDFNGDGVSDLLFRENSTGNWGVAQMNKTGGYSWLYQGGSTQSYSVAGTGDFNGDGVTDILFRDNHTGDWGYAAMHGTSYVWNAEGGSTASYTAVATGDYNGDGFTDIAFREASTGNWGYEAMAATGPGTWHNMGGSTASYFVF